MAPQLSKVGYFELSFLNNLCKTILIINANKTLKTFRGWSFFHTNTNSWGNSIREMSETNWKAPEPLENAEPDSLMFPEKCGTPSHQRHCPWQGITESGKEIWLQASTRVKRSLFFCILLQIFLRQLFKGLISVYFWRADKSGTV